MSANENFELAVQLRGEGIDETADDLSDVEGQFDETSAGVSESADEMEGFASRFDGAFTAIMAGLAVAATGLLSQVPVIGSVMRGLASIVNAVAFQIDGVLRPALEPVASFFFDIADAIFNANGPLGTLVGILGTAAIVAGLVAGALAVLNVVAVNAAGGFALLTGTTLSSVAAKLSNIAATISETAATIANTVAQKANAAATFLVSNAKRVAAAATGLFTAATLTEIGALAAAKIATIGLTVATLAYSAAVKVATTVTAIFASIVALPVVAIVALIAALVALIAIFTTDFLGIRTIIENVIGALVDGFAGAVDRITGFVDDLVDSAFGWGADLVRNFADGILSMAGAPLDAAQDVIGGITQAIGFDVRANDRMAERWGEDLMTHMGIGIDRNRSEAVPTISAEGGGDGGPSRPASDSRPAVFLDGDRVDENLRRRRDRETSPRGRFGTGR